MSQPATPMQPDRDGEVSECEHVRRSVEEFACGREARRQLADFMKRLMAALGEACCAPPAVFRVSARSKGLFSFAEKARRRCPGEESKLKYTAPQHQHTDLVGARLVVPTRIEAEMAVRRLLELEEEGAILIDHKNSFRREKRLGRDQFGYRATHFIVALNSTEILGLDPEPQTPWLDEGGKAALHSDDDVHKRGYCRFKYPIEVQLRTELEDLFGNESHDRLYKREGKPPAETERLAAKLAALLEQADDVLVEIRYRLDAIRSTQIASRSVASIGEELACLSQLAEFFVDWDTTELRARRAQLEAALGNWKNVAELLGDYGDPNGVTPRNAALSRELARAWMNQPDEVARREAEALLRRVTQESPNDEEAWCELADLILDAGGATHEVLGYYQRALEANPQSVRARRSLLTTRIAMSQSLGHLDLNDPMLGEAIRLGEDQARSGLNCPAIYFDLALLQWARCEARLQREEIPVAEAVARSFNRALDFVCRGVADASNALPLQEARAQIALLLKCSHLPKSSTERLDLLADVLDLGLRSMEIRSANGSSSPSQSPSPLEKTGSGVRILAGITDESLSIHSRLDLENRFHPIFKHFLKVWDGVAVVPGSRVGIDRPLSRAKEELGGVSRVKTYWYQLSDFAGSESSGDTLHRELGPRLDSFNLRIPILYWREILNAGYSPSEVRLLGVDGGWISRFEYMLCAALGGTSALVFFDHPNDWPQPSEDDDTGRKDGTRAVYGTLRNEFWGGHRRILPLPFDHAAIGFFLEDPLADIDLSSFVALAQEIHTNYQKERTGQASWRIDESVKDWNVLSEDNKRSNIEAAAAYKWKLEFNDILIALSDASQEKDYGERVSTLQHAVAIAEHGRWMVDKLLSGIRFGPRDAHHRTQLVQWKWLPESERRHDVSQTIVLNELASALARSVAVEQGAKLGDLATEASSP